jgi:hypothetical protein
VDGVARGTQLGDGVPVEVDVRRVLDRHHHAHGDPPAARPHVDRGPAGAGGVSVLDIIRWSPRDGLRYAPPVGMRGPEPRAWPPFRGGTRAPAATLLGDTMSAGCRTGQRCRPTTGRRDTVGGAAPATTRPTPGRRSAPVYVVIRGLLAPTR